MKRTSIIFKLTMLLFFVFEVNVHAQSFEEENAKVMERMDIESFRSKVVLNKAIVMEHQLEPFRRRIRDKDGSYRMYLEPNTIQDIFDICERGNMAEMKKPEAVKRIELRSRNAKSEGKSADISFDEFLKK